MSKEEVKIEIDLEEIINKKVDEALSGVLQELNENERYFYGIKNVIEEKISKFFIEKYQDEIIEKIDKKELANLVSQRSTIELAKNFAGTKQENRY